MASGAKPAGGLNTVIGEVHTIENQGSYVKVTLEMPDDEEFVANVLDESFFSNPLDIGAALLGQPDPRHAPGQDAPEQAVLTVDAMHCKNL